MNEPLDSTVKDRRASRVQSAQALLLPELRGHRAAFAGVESAELLQRGCDQRGMLDGLAAKGVRHVIVPLNGASEDSCLFARKHVDSSTHTPNGAVLYDLERRDEGTFTRLKFLLEAAASAGLLVGLSLFDALPGDASGPFQRGGNIQGLEMQEGPAAHGGKGDERWRAILGGAADWICSAARGFRGVWIEIFRHSPGAPGALERALCTRVAETLGRHGEDLSPTRLGPWIATRRANLIPEKHATQAAPFDTSREVAGLAPDATAFRVFERAESAAGTSESDLFFARSPARRPALLRFAENTLDGDRSEWLWRAFFRGYWPTVAARLGTEGDTRLVDVISSIARFAVAWAGRSALRPSPEILASIPDGDALDACFAAEDGAGRYFVYFAKPPERGLTLALPVGFYRFYWSDPAAGRIVDRGDSAENGGLTGIPGSGNPLAKVLVVEQDESPDTLSVW